MEREAHPHSWPSGYGYNLGIFLTCCSHLGLVGMKGNKRMCVEESMRRLTPAARLPLLSSAHCGVVFRRVWLNEGQGRECAHTRRSPVNGPCVW